MKAVMLAAGVGKRLGEAGQGQPKCLLECGGRSLLDRHLEALTSAGVRELHIVTGWRAEAIEAAVQTAPMAVRLLYNPCYRRGSLLSLWHASALRLEGPAMLLMDADVLYDASLLQGLVRHSGNNCLLLDRHFIAGEEPVQVLVQAGRIVAFGKNPPRTSRADLRGESVGFFRLSSQTWQALQARAGHWLRQGRDDAEYEQVLQEVILQPPAGEHFHYLDITGTAWTEIDFPEDLQRGTSMLARID